MRLRDPEQSSDRRSKRRDHSNERHAAPPSPQNEEQLDHLLRRMLSRTLDKFEEPSRREKDTKDTKDTSNERPSHGSQNNELARLVLGQVAQFAVKKYLQSRKQKAAKKRSRTKRSVQMPFLYGDGGRPIRSGERERMQRRRETGRSTQNDAPYDGNDEIHLTDPLPPEPVPVVLPPRDPVPEPKLRRRRRHHNLSGREPVDAPRETRETREPRDAPATRPPLVIPPSPEVKPKPPALSRSFTWDSTPAFRPAEPAGTPGRSRYSRQQEPLQPPLARSPYAYHPNYPINDSYYPPPASSRRYAGARDPPTPPLSPYRPRGETLREHERRRESERDMEREQRRRDREDEKERRQRKEAERERERPRERERGSERERERESERIRESERLRVERSRTAALALSLDDLLKQLRATDDLVYHTVYRPAVEKYNERRTWETRANRDCDRGRDWCSCRSIIMQSAGLQRSLARSRSSALAVRDLLDAPLLEDRRKRRRSTVHFASEQTM